MRMRIFEALKFAVSILQRDSICFPNFQTFQNSEQEAMYMTTKYRSSKRVQHVGNKLHTHILCHLFM